MTGDQGRGRSGSLICSVEWGGSGRPLWSPVSADACLGFPAVLVAYDLKKRLGWVSII